MAIPTRRDMTAAHAAELLDSFEAAGVPVWVGGGWGVDALMGRETRPHRDLDIMVPIEREPALRSVLENLGYVVETDWWPARVEFAGESYVDTHPLRFADDGGAQQAGLDGATFDYPPSAFVTGVIAGRVIGCLSVDQQLVFHSGYEPRSVDRHDIALLEQVRLAGG